MDEKIALAIARFPKVLTRSDVGLDDSPPHAVRAFCDAYARRVAERYLAGDLSWTDGDVAINEIFALMTQECGNSTPDYAWDVYLAFDGGEWVQPGKPGGDEYTRPRILALVEEER
ncbi:MAG TPA: hypothetical protein VMJ10_33315 [Kofleriaceae bacterium]|nr:hypothetical protein [Kofleriaceae bacterium]